MASMISESYPTGISSRATSDSVKLKAFTETISTFQFTPRDLRKNRIPAKITEVASSGFPEATTGRLGAKKSLECYY